MQRSSRQLQGCRLRASDGDLGLVADFYFDVRTWSVRYVVVNTRSWPLGHLVLLDPACFGINPFIPAPSPAQHNLLRVNLTRAEIRNSPSFDLHRPVSRQQEEAYYHNYGWPALWGPGPVTPPPELTPARLPTQLHYGMPGWNDHNLHSARSLEDCAITGSDARIGTLTGFVIDDEYWGIVEILVETAAPWYASTRTLALPSRMIDSIDYDASTLHVALPGTDLLRFAKLDTTSFPKAA